MTDPVAGDTPDPAAFLRALGKRVRLLRLTRELTQDQVAVAAGMSRSFVSLIEHGTHGVDVVRLWRLAAVFGLPLHERVKFGPTAADRAEGLPSQLPDS